MMNKIIISTLCYYIKCEMELGIEYTCLQKLNIVKNSMHPRHLMSLPVKKYLRGLKFEL